jgi:hypothetical protein
MNTIDMAWFNPRLYDGLSNLSLQEFYFELDLRHQLTIDSKYCNDLKEFWFDKIINKGQVYASEFGGDHDLVCIPQIYTKLLTLRNDYKHRSLSSSLNSHAVTMDEAITYLEVIDNDCDFRDIEKSSPGFSSTPLSLLLNRKEQNGKNILISLDLSAGNDELLSALKDLIPKWRKELAIPFRPVGTLKNATVKYLRDCFDRKIIQIMDIQFYCKYRGFEEPSSQVLMDVVFEKQYLYDFKNFKKTILKDTIDAIKDIHSMKKIRAAMTKADFDYRTTKISDI